MSPLLIMKWLGVHPVSPVLPEPVPHPVQVGHHIGCLPLQHLSVRVGEVHNIQYLAQVAEQGTVNLEVM